MQDLCVFRLKWCAWVLAFMAFPVIAQTTPATPAEPAAKPATPAVVAPSSIEEEAPIECAVCHKELYDNMAGSRHGASGDARTPWGKAGDGRNEMCTACHGKADEHAKNPIEEKPETVFGKTTLSEDKSVRCLACHQGGNRMHWAGAAHDRSGVACSDCHKVHAVKDQVLVQATQAGVCFTCHKEVRSAMMRVSAHPIRSGQLTCTSCHQPHGAESDKMVIKDTINDTCYTCHADKRGPFLWEHAPVRDSCVNCHSPHGTNNRPMLVARRPQLCQQCHIPTYHPATNYDGSSLPPNAGSDKMLNFSCQNCHTKVHGSNHPSGGNLTR